MKLLLRLCMGCFAIFIMILLPVIDIIDGVNSKEKSKYL